MYADSAIWLWTSIRFHQLRACSVGHELGGIEVPKVMESIPRQSCICYQPLKSVRHVAGVQRASRVHANTRLWSRQAPPRAGRSRSWAAWCCRSGSIAPGGSGTARCECCVRVLPKKVVPSGPRARARRPQSSPRSRLTSSQPGASNSPWPQSGTGSDRHSRMKQHRW